MQEYPSSRYEPPEADPQTETWPAEGAEMSWLYEAYPALRDVRLELVGDPLFEGGVFHVPDFEGDEIKIRISAGGAGRFAAFKESREVGVRSMAEQLGIPFERIDGEIIRRFILFHEAGHAYDFMTNFADRMKMCEAVDAWIMNSDMQLDHLPFPGLSPAELREDLSVAGGFDAWRAQNTEYEARCRANGIVSVEELFRLQEVAYRQLDKELYADEFATNAIRLFGSAGKLQAA